MRRIPVGLAALTVAALGLPAYAQMGLRLSPLAIDIPAPAQASSITLQNTGAGPLSLQMRVFAWSQADGRDQLSATDEVVASPPAARIPPGAAYTIRVARVGSDRADKNYRLWIDELPPAEPPRAAGGQVAVRVRYDVPVFFHQPGAVSKVSWRAYRSGDDLVVEASNSGLRSERVQGLKIESPKGELTFGRGLNGYVLAGAARRWSAPAAVIAGDVGPFTLVASDGNRETRQAIAFARP